MDTKYYIGIDQGTTNMKAGLFDITGKLVKEASHQFSMLRPEPGIVEQDPDEWWEALCEILRDVLSEHSNIKVSALAFCSQVNSHIFADSDGNALTRVITWQDLRPLKYVKGLNEKIARDQAAYPKGFSVDETALVARAEWIKKENPEIWEHTAYIFSPKDYLNMRLTGNAASDALSSIGMVTEDGDNYLPYLDKLVPGVYSRLPKLIPFRSALGKIKKTGNTLLDACLTDTIVAEGTMDLFGNLYGSGATNAGDAIEVTGTCEIVGSLSNTTTLVPGVCYFPKIDGLYVHAGPTKSGGASQLWMCKVFGIDIKEFVELAESVEPGADGLIFLPYLEGERAPLWDGTAKGVFFGLTGAHGKAHMCRAVMEGVAFSARHLAEEIDKASGYRAEHLRISGGSSQSDICCQIRSDILNRVIDRIQVNNSGLIGAALIATVAAGDNEDMNAAAKALVHVEKSFLPRNEYRKKYDNMYRIYRKLYENLKECYEMASGSK